MIPIMSKAIFHPSYLINVNNTDGPYNVYSHISSQFFNYVNPVSVREITKSISTFSATNISSNMIWFFSTAWYNQNEIKSFRNQL